MSEPLTIREATGDDVAVIAAIYNASIRAGVALIDDTPKSLAQVRKPREGFTPREAYLLLERGNAGRCTGFRHYASEGPVFGPGSKSIPVHRQWRRSVRVSTSKFGQLRQPCQKTSSSVNSEKVTGL